MYGGDVYLLITGSGSVTWDLIRYQLLPLRMPRTVCLAFGTFLQICHPPLLGLAVGWLRIHQYWRCGSNTDHHKPQHGAKRLLICQLSTSSLWCSRFSTWNPAAIRAGQNYGNHLYLRPDQLDAFFLMPSLTSNFLSYLFPSSPTQTRGCLAVQRFLCTL